MSNSLIVPKGYKSKLNLLQTEQAIQEAKQSFEKNLSELLNIVKVSGPLLLPEGTGINDNLNGSERVVSFSALDLKETRVEIVQSLAKWKRIALAKYGLNVGQGLYTHMNAIRRDEVLDNIHSIYVDQWDWEKVITKKQRNMRTLKTEVMKIFRAMKRTEEYLHNLFPILTPQLPEKITFIYSQELEDIYPTLSPKERETEVAKKYGAIFIMQIGGKLISGEKHDMRSPDYDDWLLNGDLIVWCPTLEVALELSSMGIRVDAKSLLTQLHATNDLHRANLDYHQAVLNNELPFTIGGGIGQSRLCMFLLHKAHIGEVQSSVWNEQIINHCKEKKITLL